MQESYENSGKNTFLNGRKTLAYTHILALAYTPILGQI